jgi:hypothetical protein
MLPYNAAILVKISATNQIGTGAESPVNAATTKMQTKPVQMAQPFRGDSTSETQIQVNWTALTTVADTGGASISSYHLEWDKGSSQATWYDLAGKTSSYLQTSFTVTTDVVAGNDYSFRVSAVNAHGSGLVSTIVTIKASA